MLWVYFQQSRKQLCSLCHHLEHPSFFFCTSSSLSFFFYMIWTFYNVAIVNVMIISVSIDFVYICIRSKYKVVTSTIREVRSPNQECWCLVYYLLCHSLLNGCRTYLHQDLVCKRRHGQFESYDETLDYQLIEIC